MSPIHDETLRALVLGHKAVGHLLVKISLVHLHAGADW